MTQRHRVLLALVGMMSAITLGTTWTPSTATAGETSVDTLLGIDQPDCCHVIDLLVHNRARRLAGHATPVGIDVLGGQPGDLELLGVSLLREAAEGQGPCFHIRLRNNSRWAVHGFQISVVGVLNRITPHAPCRSLRIDCIDAGETKCIEIQLPARCMTMGPLAGSVAPFDTLVVAIDSLDELVECNELNNVAIIQRGEIELVAPAAPETNAIPAPDAAGPSTQPDTAPVPVPGDANPEGPAEPSQIGKIDLDSLDLDEL